MKIATWMTSLTIVSMLAAGPTLADPPHGKGSGKEQDSQPEKGKGKGKNRPDAQRQDGSEQQSESDRVHSARRFDTRDRSIVREYYVTEYRSGHCPPGLAKKNNGCMPPGQEKKWRMGHPLPRDVVFYDVPSALVIQIGTPPPGYRYVRVAADILLIAVGTAMVVDAITDLGNM